MAQAEFITNQIPKIMKVVGTFFSAALMLFIFGSVTPAFSQETPHEKVITIVRKSVEPDGTEHIETIIKRGKAAEGFDEQAFLRENAGAEVDIHIIDSEKIRLQVEEALENALDRAYEKSDIDIQDKRAFLGVDEDSDEDKSEPGITVQIVCGSAAAKAGLKTNDIILKLNDTPVNKWSELSSIIGKSKPGDALRIEYRRGPQTLFTTATLTTREEAKCPEKRKGFLGISPENEGQDRGGVWVSISKNSAAEKAGLKDNDIIIQMDDVEIRDWEDITDFMVATNPGQTILITYLRDDKRQTASAILGEEKGWDWSAWSESHIDLEIPDIHLDLNIREKPACLGVYTRANDGEDDEGEDNDEEGEDKDGEEGARVTDFTSESAAKEALMKVGDVITAVNGQAVDDHESLWGEIAKYQPNEAVDIDFLRDGKSMQVKATLKSCRDKNKEVTINKIDSVGNTQGRQFFLFNFDRNDQERLRERRVITIHRGVEGDGRLIDTEAKPAPGRQLELRSFRAYPNPTPGQVTVEFQANPEPTIVSLYDLSGKQLFREELNAFGGEYFQQFDLSEYAKGTIIIQVLQNDRFFNERIIVN